MSLPAQVHQLVGEHFGVETEIVADESPGDWQVARLRLITSDGESTVVAKWLRSDPRGWRSDPRQMVVEAAGLRFADELAPGLVPQVIASSFDAQTGGAILLEDLHPREPLDALIRREGAEATTAARLAYARAMGRLAAATTGRDGDFRRRLGEATRLERRLNVLGPPWERLRSTLLGFGIAVPAAAEREMQRLRRFFAEPGPFLALSNGDMATNNFMIDNDRADDGRLIDFEFAHFDHAVAHAANFFVPGPRWIVVNDPVADELDAEFRTALTAGVPAGADDELYPTSLAAGCVAMGFERCGNLTVMDGRDPGHLSRAQRVATIEAAAAAAEGRGRWSALTDLLRELATILRRRWPDADRDFVALGPYTARID